MAHSAGHITETLDLGAIDARHRGEVLRVWVDGPDAETLVAHLHSMRACDEALKAAFWSELAQGKLALWLCAAWGVEPHELGAFVLTHGPFVYVKAARRSAAMLTERMGETLAALSFAQQLGRYGRD